MRMFVKSSTLSSKFWNVVRIIAALLLIGFVLSRTNRVEFLDLLHRISVPWLTIYILFFLVMILLKALQYHSLTGDSISYTQVLSVVALQTALSNYLATTAGIASYVAMFRAEHGIKLNRSIAIFLLTKVSDLIVIWAALIVSSLMVWQTIGILQTLISILVVGISLVILLFLLAVTFRHHFVSYLILLAYRFGGDQISIVRTALASLQALSEIEQEKIFRTFAKTFILSAAYFIVSVMWVYIGYMVFEFPQNLYAITFVSTLIQVVSYLPVQVFGGLGVTETSALYFWSPFQVSQPRLASFLVGSRLLFYLLNLLPLLYLSVSTVLQKRKQ